MSDHGAYEDEMGRFRRLSKEELARLYAGTAPTADRILEDLADFMQDVATVLTEAPDGSTEARHLAAIAEAAQLLTEDATAAGFERKPFRFTRRRRLVPNTLRLKIALAAVLALAAFSGAAYAGALPDQVQRPVADIADNVGVSLPDGPENDVDQGNVNDLDQGIRRTWTTDPRTTSTTVRRTTSTPPPRTTSRTVPRTTSTRAPRATTVDPVWAIPAPRAAKGTRPMETANDNPWC